MKLLRALLLSIGVVSTLILVVTCIALTSKISQFLPLGFLVVIVVIIVAGIIYKEY